MTNLTTKNFTQSEKALISQMFDGEGPHADDRFFIEIPSEYLADLDVDLNDLDLSINRLDALISPAEALEMSNYSGWVTTETWLDLLNQVIDGDLSEDNFLQMLALTIKRYWPSFLKDK